MGYGEDRIVWEQALDIRVWLGLKEDEKGISQNGGEGEAIGGISKKLHPTPAANPVCKGHRLSVSPHVPAKRELKADLRTFSHSSLGCFTTCPCKEGTES